MSSFLEELRQIDRVTNDPIARLKAGEDDAEDGFEPVDLRTRMSAKMKVTEGGVQSFLEERYGKGNVEAVGGGNYAIRRSGAKPLLLEGAGNAFAEFGKDILDVLPEVQEAALTGVGGYLGAAAGSIAGGVGAVPGAVIGGAAGAAAGRYLRQKQSEFLEGKDFESGTDAALDIGKQAVIGGATEGVASYAAPVIAKAADKVGQVAANTLSGARRMASKARGTQAAQEAMEGATSARPRLDEITQAPDDIARYQEMKRLAPERFREHELERAAALSGDTERAVSRLGDDLGAEEATARSLVSYDKGARELMEKRSAQARVDWDEAFKHTGDRPVAAMNNTKNVIAELYAERGNVGMDVVRELADKISDGASLKYLDSQLTRFRAAKNGSEKIIGSLERDANAIVAKRILGALERDLDEVAAAPLVGRGPGGQFTPEAAGAGGRALRKARTSYREASEAIEEYENNTIEKMIKRAVPDADAAGFVAGDVEKAHGLVNQIAGGTLGDRDVARIFSVLDKVDPPSSGALKRAVFDKVMARGEGDVLTKEALESGGSWYDAQNVAKAMLGPNSKRPRLVALLGSEDHPTIQALDAVAKFGQRAGAATKEAAKTTETTSRGHKIGAIIGAGAAAWKTGGDPLSTAGGAAAGAAAGATFSKAAARFLNRKGVREAFLDPVKAGILRDAFSTPPEAANFAAAALQKLAEGMGPEDDGTKDKDDSPGSRLLSLLGGGGTGKL